MARKGKPSCASAYDTALSFLSPKARTVREVEMRLDEGSYSEGEIMQTIERLTEAGLLDDEKYARDFAESRLRTKPVSRFRIGEQLKGHFVPSDIIDKVLSEISEGTELENARTLVEKYMRQFEKIGDEAEKRRRVYARLVTRGFGAETIKAALGDERFEDA